MGTKTPPPYHDLLERLRLLGMRLSGAYASSWTEADRAEVSAWLDRMPASLVIAVSERRRAANWTSLFRVFRRPPPP